MINVYIPSARSFDLFVLIFQLKDQIYGFLMVTGSNGGFQLSTFRESPRVGSPSLKRTPELNRYGNSPFAKSKASLPS